MSQVPRLYLARRLPKRAPAPRSAKVFTQGSRIPTITLDVDATGSLMPPTPYQIEKADVALLRKFFCEPGAAVSRADLKSQFDEAFEILSEDEAIALKGHLEKLTCSKGFCEEKIACSFSTPPAVERRQKTAPASLYTRIMSCTYENLWEDMESRGAIHDVSLGMDETNVEPKQLYRPVVGDKLVVQVQLEFTDDSREPPMIVEYAIEICEPSDASNDTM